MTAPYGLQGLGRVRQIALVVEDLEASVHAYADLLGVGPWSAYELSSDFLQDMTYDGAPAEFTFLHALAWSGETQLELVQPLRGPSIFADHLAQHGPGLHHVGIVVEDHAGWVQRFKDAGFAALQSARGFGADGTGAFCYFDLGHPVAGIVELISPPKVRRDPLYVYGEDRA
jgi:catechol 2,3-dioxygenase-like lactoylglutathione lyase family enzyme